MRSPVITKENPLSTTREEGTSPEQSVTPSLKGELLTTEEQVITSSEIITTGENDFSLVHKIRRIKVYLVVGFVIGEFMIICYVIIIWLKKIKP